MSRALQADRAELARIGLSPRLRRTIYRPKDAGLCRNTGYRGRIAIQELMVMDDEIRALVMQKADASMIRRACTPRG